MNLDELVQLVLEELSADRESSSVEEMGVSTELLGDSATRMYYSFKRQISPGGSTYISINAGISQDFSQEQIDIIKDAIQLYFQRNLSYLRTSPLGCVLKYGSTYPRNPAFPFPHISPDPKLDQGSLIYVATYLSTGNYLKDGEYFPSEYRILLINRFDKDPVSDPVTGRTSYTLGLAGVNIYAINNQILEISLNGKFIGAGSSYPSSTNKDVWAGVIGHEILHNLGWEHGADNTSTYIGEYGRCIERDGADQPLALVPLPYDEICGTVSS